MCVCYHRPKGIHIHTQARASADVSYCYTVPQLATTCVVFFIYFSLVQLPNSCIFLKYRCSIIHPNAYPQRETRTINISNNSNWIRAEHCFQSMSLGLICPDETYYNFIFQFILLLSMIL